MIGNPLSRFQIIYIVSQNGIDVALRAQSAYLIYRIAVKFFPLEGWRHAFARRYTPGE
jgi:hypothetical protein